MTELGFVILTKNVRGGAVSWDADWDGGTYSEQEMAEQEMGRAIESLGWENVKLARLVEVTPTP